jgi:FlaA1/EpsC-like NDP-sugar epimerase
MTDSDRKTEITATAGSAEKVASFTTTLALGLRPPRGHAVSAAEGSAKKSRVVVTGGSGKLGRAVVRDVRICHSYRIITPNPQPYSTCELVD